MGARGRVCLHIRRGARWLVVSLAGLAGGACEVSPAALCSAACCLAHAFPARSMGLGCGIRAYHPGLSGNRLEVPSDSDQWCCVHGGADGSIFPAEASETYNIAMTDELLRYRSEFPILERTTYLISNSLGAMPRAVYDAMKGYADMWATRGVRAWEERWWMLAAEVGDEIGALMNAPKGSVSTHQNVTTCQAVVASCFDLSGKRNKIVYSDMNFPSVMYFWEAQQQYGARVHMVKTDDGITVPTERLLDAIDETTLLVPISHVIFRSAYIPSLEAARPGLKIISEVGVSRIREKSKRQTSKLIELADRHGWRVNTPRDPEKRGGTVSIDMPDSQEVCRELLSRDILVDWRPKAGVRFSPHFYNTDQELETAIAAVEEILKERAVAAR